MDQYPRLPGASAEAKAEWLRAIRDFHFGRGGAAHPALSWRPAAPATCGLVVPAASADPTAPLRELLEVARTEVPARREAFATQLRTLRDGLADLLAVEDQRDPGPERLRASVGAFGADLVDASALDGILGAQRGSMRVDGRRRQRIEQALAVFARYLDGGGPPLLTVLHTEAGREAVPAMQGLVAELAEDPCRAALRSFDAAAERFCEVVRALRTARLEVTSSYDAERHDPWIATVDWETLSAEELSLVPTIVAVDSASRLTGEAMPGWSRLLASGRPVQVLALASPVHDPEQGLDAVFSSYRVELGFLGIGHREAFVQQTSTACAEHLREGFRRALGGTRAALHVVVVEPAPLSVASRAHPLFRYDPDSGGSWARRLDVSGNPDPELDWPVTTLTCLAPGGRAKELELAVTFVDHALQESALTGEALVVSDEYRSDDLVPLADYLRLDAETAARRLPCLWVQDEDQDLHRAVPTRRLTQACRDRLAFWRSLQELAGIHSEHVERALERARDEARQGREELEAQRAAELEQVRSEAVGQAAHLLAATLVGVGVEDLVGLAPVTAPAVPVSTPAAPAAAAPAAAEAEVPAATATISSEPWIETALCTSCNDCRNINPQLFVYDDNKQAKIGDPSAGTFAQLVKAAEKCPARCIHPGQPLDPNEKGLDKLIARAAPFNR